MTRAKRILTRGAIGLAVVALVAAYFGSPVLALHSLTEAAKTGDRAKLERLVDFPAVRESLKSQLKAAMTRAFEEDPELRDNPFAAFGQLLMVGVVDKAVDAYATPDAIAQMVATSRAPSKISPSDHGPHVETGKPRAKSDTEIRYGYQGLDRFKATYRDKAKPDEPAFGLTLERQGLFRWKLVRIDLAPAT
ncbi:DUF2939 domain-containing protein [Caulobacter vibrioides]|uniref:DUF2939 domain-containing protein n=2 Tax=Caulobacter vibrioides TaxID=155892 RepID=Q9A7H1_CAUVC|nr:DUF2939 domain-containing protein [Caulobacter vibrioides]YP_002517201.1 conserved hypothetical protein [Caulobacter vibrioides NA1000]AAK23728.1 hypothetical protein CC_1752 [Caulobacter vibrioides CB15]ACL95293.1 conserved hypothetical protein [Caulobacter vibrioides NA1000]ATC28630.1 DUF2939 domain-containing protein [Caulobacter vibrioides]QXZ53812.1 DUF2939 domain-containing protein [Caulobacter vibrioides]